MSSSWICSHCGCNTNHFNSTRCCLVCDTCGTEVRSELERNADIDYQRNMALAKQHLRVGNWEEAKRLVVPYKNSRPADKQVYLYLLIAVTKCFEDYLLDNSDDCKEAAQYWDKLSRLGFVNSAMINYSQQRNSKLLIKKSELRFKQVMIFVINSVLTLFTIGSLFSGVLIFIILLIVTITGWIHGVNWLKNHKSEDII